VGDIKTGGASVYRDFVVDGVPASGPNDPAKGDIRRLFSLIDAAVAAAQASITTVATTADRDTFYATEANRGKLVYVNNNNGSATDAANGVYEYVGSPRLARAFYQGVATIVQPLVDKAEAAADQASDLLNLIGGVPLAVPINGNPNNIFVNYDNWQNDARFEALIMQDVPSGTPTITVPNHLVDLKDAPAGSLKAGMIATFVISFGVNAIFLRGTRYLPQLASLSKPATDLFAATNDTVYAPYGDVSLGGAGKPVFAPRKLAIGGRGSSVSTDPGSDRNGASPPGQAPVQFLADLYNAQFGPYLSATPYNLSHGGHVASHGDGQWDEIIAAAGKPTDVLFDCFGMNDLSPYSYNSGQTADYLRNPIYYEAELRRRSGNGVKLILLATTPHPHTGRYPYNLNGVNMTWPYSKASPVQPDEMVPPAAQSVVTRDWTGGGVTRPGDVRAGHVNIMIRNIARRLHLDPTVNARVALLDVEWAWFRYGAEIYSLDQLYNTGEIVHPNLLGHQVSYQRCIREFVTAMRLGRGDQWCFRGEIGS